MQVSLQRPYRPPKLGFLPPPPLRLAGIGAPSPDPAATTSKIMNGYGSKGPMDAIFMVAGGVGLSYFSRFFPGIGEPIAMVGGLGLVGLGVYEFYNVVTGKKEPVETKEDIPPGQVPEDVYQLQAKLLKPVENGKAELSDMWASILGTQMSFPFSYVVTNFGKKTVKATIVFRTTESTRPLFGKAESVDWSSLPYILTIGPGETKTVDNVWQPFEPLMTIAPVDIFGRLILKAFAADEGIEVDRVHFTAGG